MARRRLIVSIAALALLVVVFERAGSSLLERDRAEMYRTFADDRIHRLEAAALELANDVEEIGQDLELAAVIRLPVVGP